jgi:uncharacterized Zn-finger protein
MDALAKAAFSAEAAANDHQLKPSQPPTSHLPTPQSPVVPFPPIMVSRESSTVDKWSHTSSSPIRNSQSPPSTNATVSAAITSRSGYGSFPLKSASSDDNNGLSSDKPFVCKECDQTFSRPHNLKSHLATHSAERPYQVSFIGCNTQPFFFCLVSLGLPQLTCPCGGIFYCALFTCLV